MSKCRCEYMGQIEVDLRLAISQIDQVIHATPNSTKGIWIPDKYRGEEDDYYYTVGDHLNDIKQFLESLNQKEIQELCKN